MLLAAGGCERRSTPTQATAYTGSSGQRKILVVHSYHPGYQWVAAVNRGIFIIISLGAVNIVYFYMDTKNHPQAEWRQRLAREALEAVEEWEPDVVITVDDDAQEEVGRTLAGRANAAVVFCGVNGEMTEYGYASGNVTGVLERPHFRETIHLFRQLASGARRLFALSDSGKTSEGAFAWMQREAEGLTDLEVVDWAMVTTFDEWKRRVLEAQTQADAIAVYTYHTLFEDADSSRSVPPRQVMEWTVQNSAIPIIGFQVFSVDDGSLCGVLESGVSQGATAARMALRIIQGSSPSSLPIETSLKGQRMINLEVARKLAIPVDPALLEETDIIVQCGPDPE